MEYKAIESVLQTINPHTGKEHFIFTAFCWEENVVIILVFVLCWLEFGLNWITSSSFRYEITHNMFLF